MDNNKKVELNKIEYENLYTVKEINKVSISRNQVDGKIASKFSEAMKKAKNSKKKKSTEKREFSGDIVVDSSLKKLIEEDNEIKKTVQEKLVTSRQIRELLSKDEIIPSNEVSIKQKTGI